jgi:hypothetical protein
METSLGKQNYSYLVILYAFAQKKPIGICRWVEKTEGKEGFIYFLQIFDMEILVTKCKCSYNR